MLDELHDIFKLKLDKSEFEKLKMYYIVLILNKYNGYKFDDIVLDLISNFESSYSNEVSNIECGIMCSLVCNGYGIEECNHVSLFEHILKSDNNKHCFVNPVDTSSGFIFTDDQLKYESKCIEEGNKLINFSDKSSANELCGLNENTKWITIYENKYTYQIPQICCENCQSNDNTNDVFFNSNILTINTNSKCFCLTTFDSDSNCEGEIIVDPINGVFGETCMTIDNELSVKPFYNGTIAFFEDGICSVGFSSQPLFYPICLTGLGNFESDININEIDCNSNESSTADPDVPLIIGVIVSVVIVLAIMFIAIFMFAGPKYNR